MHETNHEWLSNELTLVCGRGSTHQYQYIVYLEWDKGQFSRQKGLTSGGYIVNVHFGLSVRLQVRLSKSPTTTIIYRVRVLQAARSTECLAPDDVPLISLELDC